MARWDVIIELLQDRPHSVGAEIGVRYGRTMDRVLQALPDIERYICVDPWKTFDGYEIGQAKLDEARLEFAGRARAHTYRLQILPYWSHQAVNFVPDDSCDWVFIDAAHDYDNVARDIRLWAPKVHEGGLLMGHDYGNSNLHECGVKRAVDEAFTEVKKGQWFVWHATKTSWRR